MGGTYALCELKIAVMNDSRVQILPVIFDCFQKIIRQNIRACHEVREDNNVNTEKALTKQVEIFNRSREQFGSGLVDP
jgi:hypothetical protein